MLLYHLNEFKKAAMWPTHLWSEANNLFLQNLPFESTSLTRILSASNEVMERTTRHYTKPNFNIRTVKRKSEKNIKIEEKVIREKPFCTLKQFVRKQNDVIIGKNEPTVLIVPPLSGHFATLLRGTAETMLMHHNVYIIDWHDSRLIPLKYGEFSVETYVDYLLEFMANLGPDIHVMAVCQPAVPVLMAVSILAERGDINQPKSMILMGGPIDTRINPGKVDIFAKEHDIDWFKRNVITKIPAYYPGAGRDVCPGFIMLSGFMSLNYERHKEANFNLFLNLVKGDLEHTESHRKFYDEYRSVMDLPAEYFLESITSIFQEHDLPKEKMQWKGQIIKPKSIQKTALMTIEGELDDISPPGQTFAAHKLCSSLSKNLKQHYCQRGVGHYGIFNGHRWREEIYPKIKIFISENNK
ncbi:MAG: polyhydroxyalkanoate depolymerase [Alphaproteobacteria bacterium]|nr:polyhydroxyalkanoate depolymerase [Alphaproteobacteria bacterium]